MTKSIKGFISGFLVACLLFTVSFTASASIREFVLKQVDYPIVVNGVEYKDENLPVLSYQGNTYVPLRGFCNMVGKSIIWNSELSQVELGVTEIIPKIPIEPLNNITKDNLLNYFKIDGMTFTVSDLKINKTRADYNLDNDLYITVNINPDDYQKWTKVDDDIKYSAMQNLYLELRNTYKYPEYKIHFAIVYRATVKSLPDNFPNGFSPMMEYTDVENGEFLIVDILASFVTSGENVKIDVDQLVR